MKNDLSIRAAVYLRAAELVEQGHCKGSLVHCDASGHPVAWCLVGAVIFAEREIGRLRPQDWKFGINITSWNNHPDTTAAMVATKLREQAFGD